MKNILFLTLIIFSSYTRGEVNVVTTLPEFKWLVDEIGQGNIKSTSLLNGSEDPHFIDAVPSFIVKASNADLLVFNGMQLEMGWLPKVIQMAGNKKINIGQNGSCDASKDIDKKQVITSYDRSMGDVHPTGNPHYTLSVVQMKKVSKTLTDCLIKLEMNKKALYLKNYQAVLKKLTSLESYLKVKAQKLRKLRFMSYHLEFVYLFSDFKLKSYGTLEKVPGILPSAFQLLEKAKSAKHNKVDLVLAGNTNPKKYLDKFKESTKIPYLILDLHMTDKFQDYITYQKSLFEQMIKYADKN